MRNVQLQLSWIVAMLFLTPVTCCIAAEADQVFQQLFGDRLKQVQGTRSTTDDAAFAKELLDSAAMALDQKELLGVICEQSYQLGMTDPQGFATAIASMRLLSKHIPDRSDSVDPL